MLATFLYPERTGKINGCISCLLQFGVGGRQPEDVATTSYIQKRQSCALSPFKVLFCFERRNFQLLCVGARLLNLGRVTSICIGPPRLIHIINAELITLGGYSFPAIPAFQYVRAVGNFLRTLCLSQLKTGTGKLKNNQRISPLLGRVINIQGLRHRVSILLSALFQI